MFRGVIRMIYTIFSLCAGIALLLSGCAGRQLQIAPVEKEGKKIVEMRAESFRFEPDNIKVLQGDTIIFAVNNVSGSEHNFTIRNPQQEILKYMDIPALRTARFEVTFQEPGIYEFYCDKPLHAAFGMKGQVEVVKK